MRRKGSLFGKIAVTLAILLSLGASGVAIGMGVKHNGWFEKAECEHVYVDGVCEECGEKEVVEENSAVSISPSAGSGVRLMSAVLDETEYETYGISEQAESAYTLTAMVSPVTAVNKEVDWELAWANGSSAWANGKTVTDYVTLTPTADGALTAVVACLQLFEEQIKVSVISRYDPNIKADCTVDYGKRLSGGSIMINGLYHNLGDSSYLVYTSLSTSYEFGTDWQYSYEGGTITGATPRVQVDFDLNPTVLSQINADTGYTYSYKPCTDFNGKFEDWVTESTNGDLSGKDGEIFYETFVNWLYNHPDKSPFIVTVSIDGDFNDLDFVFTFKFNPADLDVTPVADVSFLNSDNSIVF